MAPTEHPRPVGGVTDIIKPTDPTVSNGTAYVAGDVIGAKITLSGAIRGTGYTALLSSIVAKAEDTVTASAIDVLIFDADPTGSTFTDNAALAVVDGDLAKLIGAVTLDKAVTVNASGNSTLVQATNINLPVKGDDTNKLYVVLVARAAITFNATDALTLSFGFMQD